MTVGLPGFMAPEQILGQAGQPADVFAWSLTVAYAARGEPPFGTGPTDAILYRIMHATPDLSSVPEPLRPLFEVALAKDPASRLTAAGLHGQLTAPFGHPAGPAFAPTQALLARTWLLPPRRGRPQGHDDGVTPRAVSSDRGCDSPRHRRRAPDQQAPPGRARCGRHRPRNSDPLTRPDALREHARAKQAIPGSLGIVADRTRSRPAGSLTGGRGEHHRPEDYVAGLGYGSLGLHYPHWDSSAPLNAIVAFYNAGAASGPGKVFFFARGRLVGTDTTDGSSAVGAIRVTPTKIDAQYDLYAPGDPAAAPTAAPTPSASPGPAQSWPPWTRSPLHQAANEASMKCIAVSHHRNPLQVPSQFVID